MVSTAGRFQSKKAEGVATPTCFSCFFSYHLGTLNTKGIADQEPPKEHIRIVYCIQSSQCDESSGQKTKSWSLSMATISLSYTLPLYFDYLCFLSCRNLPLLISTACKHKFGAPLNLKSGLQINLHIFTYKNRTDW